MRTGLSVFCFLLLVVCVEETALAANKNAHLALVVGANYGSGEQVQLRYAEDDSRRVAEVLLDAAGADVELLINPSPGQIEAKLEEIKGRVRALQKKDRHVVVSFYYAGHADEEHFHLDGDKLSIRTVNKALEEMEADVAMIVLDACRGDGGVRTRGLRRVDGRDVSIVMPEGPKGIVKVHATSLGEAAQESDRLKGGVFTHFWVSGLRGAADSDRDGLVTLAEAYDYAARHTHGFSATSRHNIQWTAYDYKLTGSTELVLTRTSLAPSELVLPAGKDSVYVVRRWPSGSTIVQILGDPDDQVTVALPAGRFEVIRRSPKRIDKAMVHLPWGGDLSLEESDFSNVEETSAVLRGSTKAIAPNWVALHGGLSYIPDMPLVWQQAHIEYGRRLERLPELGLIASAGWQGWSFDLTNRDKYVRSDSLVLALGSEYCHDFSALSLSLGMTLRGEVVFQRERTKQEQRYEEAGLKSSRSRQSMRGGALLYGAARISMTENWFWGFTAAGGFMIQSESDDLAVKLYVASTTGPGFLW